MTKDLQDKLKQAILEARKVDNAIKQAKMDRDFAYPDYHDELIKSANDYKNREITKLPERFS